MTVEQIIDEIVHASYAEQRVISEVVNKLLYDQNLRLHMDAERLITKSKTKE
jgi:hypothetical protein